MDEWRGHQWVLCALAGIIGFVCGAFVQQEASIWLLFQQIRRDPYVYHHRHKLYPMLCTFRKPDYETRLWNGSTSLAGKFRELIVLPIFDYVSAALMLKTDSATSTDLLGLVKYGLPSIENLYVHKDYIVARDMSTNAPRWICEHIRGDYQKIGSDEGGYSTLNLRYNDVYVLSCGATKICKAFKGRIWNDLEKYVSTKAQEFGSVYTYTGPIYTPSCHENGKWSMKYEVFDWTPMPVPSHYFKVLIVESRVPVLYSFMEGYIIKNSRLVGGKLSDHRAKIGDIERFTGLQFNNANKNVGFGNV
ncbi:endonuclease G, mitochondrial [Drosophila gunungcola]|uniref:endonuclease G, mitochondrial n=1 Tax=Drosophila gunungcola TaxID=103775 RepID=UPI0022E9317B|nr:endonuclease G, mitochondrial [Drosophila gunungcola]